MAFEERLKKDILARLDRAEAKMPGYQFKILRDMIEKNGAVATVKRLLDLNNVMTVQYGLEALAENDLLDCSVEQAAIDHEVSGKFSASEIAVAKAKLKLVRRKVDC